MKLSDWLAERLGTGPGAGLKTRIAYCKSQGTTYRIYLRADGARLTGTQSDWLLFEKVQTFYPGVAKSGTLQRLSRLCVVVETYNRTDRPNDIVLFFLMWPANRLCRL